MSTHIYVTIQHLPLEARDIDGSHGLLVEKPIPTFIWEEQDGELQVEIATEWPISSALRDWVERLGRSIELKHDEIEAQVEITHGGHMPDDAYWTDTQLDLDSRLPQEPGTELGVWYRSSRDHVKNSHSEYTLRVRGAWFGESFEAYKEREWMPGVLAFRGREYQVSTGSNDSHIPGLDAPTKLRIAFVRGVLAKLAEFTDGCHGGQADGVGVMLDYALKA